MKNKRLTFLISAIFITSCVGPSANTKQVKKETKQLLNTSPIFDGHTLERPWNAHLTLRANASFSLMIFKDSTRKYDFYAGEFSRTGDTLQLNFYQRIMPDYLTGKALIHSADDKIELLVKDNIPKMELTVLKPGVTNLLALF